MRLVRAVPFEKESGAMSQNPGERPVKGYWLLATGYAALALQKGHS
jgi:hypothetical protein